jgi:hypothetical protein
VVWACAGPVNETAIAIGIADRQLRARTGREQMQLTYTMLLKIIAFIAAAIPIFLFVRSVFFRRTTQVNEGLKEFKKQANLAVTIFLFLIGCVVAFAAAKLAWTWWSSF